MTGTLDMQKIRRLQESHGISYAHRGMRWRTLVPMNGWTGIVIERHRCGLGEHEVIYVSPDHDPEFATWFWRHQLEAVE